MSDDIDKANQRKFVADMYPGPRWKHRVMHVMTDAQVFAIWKREQDKGAKLHHNKESKDDGIPF